MSDQVMLTSIDGRMLAEAFPSEYQSAAMLAGNAAACLLTKRQWTERFPVQVGAQRVLIPARLHFTADRLSLTESEEAWPFARALQTRSNDGFERQRAARDLLADLQPWGAPFIVALIGEYVVEILDDILAALTPDLARTLGAFVIGNQAYWNTTKRRVTSYWNVYYRARWLNEHGRAERRDEFVGFRLLQQLETASFRAAPTANE
ncbi:hypothetical protein [Sphingomonas sp. GC_Shp_6]|uniref:hypothetical protein n=1 Tax=Sphingomonas sp. GC_Shp_6 TaxID=2937378 RepID=UPI00226A4DB4|nr:hypothetical protein [Sphingomonas sp. GC_Shp_6]